VAQGPFAKGPRAQRNEKSKKKGEPTANTQPERGGCVISCVKKVSHRHPSTTPHTTNPTGQGRNSTRGSRTQVYFHLEARVEALHLFSEGLTVSHFWVSWNGLSRRPCRVDKMLGVVFGPLFTSLCLENQKRSSARIQRNFGLPKNPQKTRCDFRFLKRTPRQRVVPVDGRGAIKQKESKKDVARRPLFPNSEPNHITAGQKGASQSR